MLLFAIGSALFLAALVAIMVWPYRVPEAATALTAGPLGAELLLVHVIDLCPRRELEHLPGPLLH